MTVIIIDTNKDIFAIKKEYPYPMELLKETENFFEVKNKRVVEQIQKKHIKNVYKITI